MFRRWATKKSAGSTKNGRDSKPKNLGVKKFGGEVRSRCFKEHKDNGDYTLLRHFFFKKNLIYFAFCVAEGDTWKHHCSPEGHTFPSRRLCGNWEGSHPLCSERRPGKV